MLESYRPSLVVAAFRLRLMSTPPPRPTHDLLICRESAPHQPPQQAAHLLHRQRNQLLSGRGPFSPPLPGVAFFCASVSAPTARITDRYACASIASVMWRYQPTQLRTS